MNLLKKLIDLILYGNFWIAWGATALTLQTHYILTGNVRWNDLLGFVFFSTWLLYSLHRIVGILRLKEFLDVERFSVIARFRHHIIVYAVIAGLGTIWYFFQLSIQVQIAVVIPALFSLGYVLPFFGGKKRLRDFDQIKIYLVAIVWAWVTVVLPASMEEALWSWSVLLLFLERTLFVFAITLPFDIRDLQVDAHSHVATIPAMIGEEKSIKLAIGLLLIAGLLVLVNMTMGFYSVCILLGLLLSFISTAFLIKESSIEHHDYFYSGLMDGTMILQGGFTFITCYLLS